jgi:hypothetical protein
MDDNQQVYGVNPELHSLQQELKQEPPVHEQPPEPEVRDKAPRPKTFHLPRDFLWLGIWILTIGALGIWDIMFLNKPALKQVTAGLFNTFFIALQVTVYTLALAWVATLILNYLESKRSRTGYLIITFLLNLTRSVPQIVGVLFGYVWITFMARQGGLNSSIAVFFLMASIMSLFIFVEMTDLMRERIHYFKTLDFYDAMRVCGISENRIINFHILWKNSRIHIFNKMIAIFGIAVFLQCSVDFIISVGLSLEADLVTLPTTLGSLLANIDSKQDTIYPTGMRKGISYERQILPHQYLHIGPAHCGH